MRIFISGGCKNGKSFYAQHYAQRLAQVHRSENMYYIATMRPVDDEDEERILRHQRDREGWNFTTVEQSVDIEGILDKCDCRSSFLLDSLTALLANEMFLPNGGFNEYATEKIMAGLRQITDTIKNIVIVSDYLYSDALLYDQLSDQYRKSLAAIDRAAARDCDVVLEIVYTNIIIHKGQALLGELHEKIP